MGVEVGTCPFVTFPGLIEWHDKIARRVPLVLIRSHVYDRSTDKKLPMVGPQISSIVIGTERNVISLHAALFPF